MAVVVPTPTCPPRSDAPVATVALRSEAYPTLAAITLETGEGVAIYTAKEKEKVLNKRYYIDGREYLTAQIKAADSPAAFIDSDYSLRSSETEGTVADQDNAIVLVQFQRGAMIYSPLLGVRDAKISYTAKNKTFHLWWTVYGFTSPDYHSDSPLNVANHDCEKVESFNPYDFFTVRQIDKTEHDLKCAAKVLLHAVGERVTLNENPEDPTTKVFLVFNQPDLVAYWPLSCQSSSSSKSSSKKSSSSKSSSRSSSQSSASPSASTSVSRSSSSRSSSSPSSSSTSISSSPSSKVSSSTSSSSKSSSRSPSSKSQSSASRSIASRGSITADCKSWITVYQNLSDIVVSIGDKIAEGAQLGKITTPFLHWALAFEDSENPLGTAVSTEDSIVITQTGTRAGGTAPISPIGITEGNIRFAKEHTIFPMNPGGCTWTEQMGDVTHDGPSYWARDFLCSEEESTTGQDVKNSGIGTGITHTVIKADSEAGLVIIRHTCPSSSRSSTSRSSSSRPSSSRSSASSSPSSSSRSSLSQSSSERSLKSKVSTEKSSKPSVSKSKASKESSPSASRSTSRQSSPSYSSQSKSSPSQSQSSSSCPKLTGCITMICDILWNEMSCSLTLVRGKLTVENGYICEDSGCSEEDNPCPTVMAFGADIPPEDNPAYVEGAIFLEEVKSTDAIKVMKTLLSLKEVTWKNVMITGAVSDDAIQILSRHSVKIHFIPQEVPGGRKQKIEEVARMIKRRTDLVVFVGSTGVEVPTDMISLEVAYKKEGALELGAATCTIATNNEARTGLQKDVAKSARVVRLGEDPNDFLPTEEKAIARRAAELRDEKVILYVGDNIQRWTRLNRLKKNILQQAQLGWVKGSGNSGWYLLERKNLAIEKTVDFLNLADLVIVEDAADTEVAKAMAWVNRIPVIVLGEAPKDPTKDLADYVSSDRDEDLLKAIERGLRSVDRVQKASRYVWENLTQKGAERKWANLLEQLIPVFLRK